MVNDSDSRSRGRGFEPHSVKPCCVLEQGTFTPQKVLVIPRKRWLGPNMTGKLFSQKLQFFVHIHPDPTPPNPTPKKMNFHKNFTFSVHIYPDLPPPPPYPTPPPNFFLAHLSRRLRGELIVYRSSRRPCVRLCVRSHFQT